MSLVDAFIDRLSGASTPFKGVARAADLAAVKQHPPAVPFAWVITEGEASGENEHATGTVLQTTEIDIAVVLVDANHSDKQGGAAARDIETLKTWVRNRLIGFSPDGADTPVEHIEFAIIALKDGYVWARDVYGTTAIITEQNHG